jgi:hypothetical protein
MAKKFNYVPKIDEIMQAIEADDYLGFCLNCGSIGNSCEPDAREYTCDDCGEKTVYGAEECLIMFGT